MIPERNNDSENTLPSPGKGLSNQDYPRLETHGDLEHTSPTDSRADEKVIVNYRTGHARLEKNAERGNINEV
jgi:hypothetical protein